MYCRHTSICAFCHNISLPNSVVERQLARTCRLYKRCSRSVAWKHHLGLLRLSSSCSSALFSATIVVVAVVAELAGWQAETDIAGPISHFRGQVVMIVGCRRRGIEY